MRLYNVIQRFRMQKCLRTHRAGIKMLKIVAKKYFFTNTP